VAKIQFIVESADATSVWIRHVRTARQFCFAVVDRKLEGTLGGEGNLFDFNLRRRARSIAMIEARARGLID
jgi:hypothetical protein